MELMGLIPIEIQSTAPPSAVWDVQLLRTDSRLHRLDIFYAQLQSYFAACEDETPAIRNHDRVLQRLCEHLDHALLYGLQDISSGYWVLVVHFTRREAVKQIEEQQHVATLLGRSRAWLYLALNENSLESYLRLFQENQSLLQKYYYKNALVCSHDHLTLFLTLVSGLEFIRFELEMDVPYLDLAPYMPEYYKPQYLLDFEDRLPSNTRGSDSLSLNSFNSINSANLEWDDSAIAPSSEDYDFGDAYPAAQSVPSTDWEDGDLHDDGIFPRPPPFVLHHPKSQMRSSVHRYNPFTQDLSSSGVTPGPGTAAETPDTSDPITQDSEIDVTSLDTTLSYNHPPRTTEPTSDSTDLSTQDVIDGLSTSESTPVHSAAKKKGAAFTTYTENNAELEVIRACAVGGAKVFIWEGDWPVVWLGMAGSVGHTSAHNPSFCLFRVDNNLLLLLMIHVFRENEEQLFKMFRMSTGHMEGDLQLLYVLLTDCYIYFLRKGAADKPYMVEDAVSYNELDYISVGLDQQTVTIVCTNRRRQFLVDTADIALTEIFIAALKSAMINGCREPPYPGVLTDATMERLALAKFVSLESKREASEVVMLYYGLYYGLVHWEDPLDEAVGSFGSHLSRDQVVSKEGVLHYKAGTSYLGRDPWKPCYVVLSNGILYQYPERTDVTPMLSINLGGEQCGGCRRANSTDRAHSFQIILTEQPSLELSAANDEDMADWMQHLCQAVSKGVIPQGGVPSPCLPCCLVLTQDKIITCHQDCQTSFFRALGISELTDLSALGTVDGKEYCVMEFTQERSHFLPPWVMYFSCRPELDRFISTVQAAWKSIYQVDLPHTSIPESSVKKCEDALALIHSAWQRSDSLYRGRSSRDPWC
ncbi:pleckstrin homology domain-containing family M member 2 [Aquarana catesbeiana]|uniref:pleckstrin homology domain-containing family M member 2 n=1 Tax=Aquarana catesbeiana TaxID=8400 RepID=UPI003CC99163